MTKKPFKKSFSPKKAGSAPKNVRPAAKNRAGANTDYQPQKPRSVPTETATDYQPRKTRPAATDIAEANPNPENWICGKNAVLEALRSGQSLNRVILADNLTGSFGAQVIKECRETGVPFQHVPRAKLAQLAGADNRGVACEVAAFSYQEVESMLALAEAKGEAPLILLLDGVEDPHNLGAVIRTALCAGAHGVVIPKRRSAALNATVLKTSAGAAAHLPVARVSNLAQTAQFLKEQGLWLAAADMQGASVWQADLAGPLAIVLGGEGKGVSANLLKQCDFTVALPIKGAVNSLNVSAAAAAILYEVCRQRAVVG